MDGTRKIILSEVTQNQKDYKIHALLSRHQRSFLLQQMGTDTGTHSQTFCRESETLEHSVLKGISPSNPSLQGSENSTEEAERIEELGV
ncbi:hypothetical protein LEMLEM_LOCUS15551, partial [Lemmus lemmus]